MALDRRQNDEVTPWYDRSVTLKWVLIGYLGCFAAAGYGNHIGDSADSHIVESGRVVIKNGCHFDNVRAHQLRKILRNGLKNQRKQFKAGVIPRQRYVESRRLTKAGIQGITIRDCAREAMTLDDD